MTAHLASFLAKHNRGMDDACEQVEEAAQNSMESVLQRHKVLEDNYKHGERQLVAIVKFASLKVLNLLVTKKTRKSKKKWDKKLEK